jgi:hypothetical protein
MSQTPELLALDRMRVAPSRMSKGRLMPSYADRLAQLTSFEYQRPIAVYPNRTKAIIGATRDATQRASALPLPEMHAMPRETNPVFRRQQQGRGISWLQSRHRGLAQIGRHNRTTFVVKTNQTLIERCVPEG